MHYQFKSISFKVPVLLFLMITAENDFQSHWFPFFLNFYRDKPSVTAKKLMTAKPVFN